MYTSKTVKKEKRLEIFTHFLSQYTKIYLTINLTMAAKLFKFS